MMPLTIAGTDEEHVIKKVGGSPEIRSHLEDMGLVCGGTVRVISAAGEDLIVSVKGVRIALNDQLARKIMV